MTLLNESLRDDKCILEMELLVATSLGAMLASTMPGILLWTGINIKETERG